MQASFHAQNKVNFQQITLILNHRRLLYVPGRDPRESDPGIRS